MNDKYIAVMKILYPFLNFICADHVYRVVGM